MAESIAQRLIDNEARLIAGWGDALPQVTPEVIAAADRAVVAGGKVSDAGPGWMTGMNPHNLGSLAAAYRKTRDNRYAAVVRDYLGYWVEKELDAEGKWAPPPNLDALKIPHRMGDTECIGWFGALPHVLESGLFDEAFLDCLVDSARRQWEHLASDVFEGRNIRMTQGDGLFTAGERLNWLSEAPRWRQLGLDILNDAFNRQVGPDGTGECTGWYHYIEANMALRYWRLGRAWPQVVIQLTADRVGRMFDYLAGVVEPAGHLNRIGDCTAGMPPDNRLASVLERHLSVCRELGRPAEPPATSQFFPNAQQAFWRSGWTDKADYVTFDATRRYGYHWHPSLNAIQLHIAGQRVLADPGRMTYNNTPQRRYACSTRAHSTMNLNGMNQTHVRPTVRHRTIDGYDLIDSSYQGGYWDDAQVAGIFGEHHRTVLWIRGRMLVVIDHMLHHQGEGQKPTVECNWQFAPGKVALDAAGARVFSEHGPAKMTMLFALQPAGAEIAVHEGLLEGDRCAGWVADASDQPAPAPLVRCAWKAFDPWNFDLATVLIPYAGKPPQVTVEETGIPDGRKGPARFALRWADGRRDEFWWKRRLEYALDDCGRFTTDAAFAHLCTDPAGKLTQAMLFDGSYIRPFTKSVRPAAETFIHRP